MPNKKTKELEPPILQKIGELSYSNTNLKQNGKMIWGKIILKNMDYSK